MVYNKPLVVMSTKSYTLIGETAKLRITGNIPSTSTTTGALVVTAGVGIGGDLYVGGTTYLGSTTFSGPVTITDTTDCSGLGTGALIVSGGASIAKNLCVGGDGHFSATTASSSVSTGAVVVDGGVGIADDVYIGSDLDVTGHVGIGGVAVSSSFVTLINETALTGVGHVKIGDGSTVTPPSASANFINFRVATNTTSDVSNLALSQAYNVNGHFQGHTIDDPSGAASGTITRCATLYVEGAPTVTGIGGVTISRGPYAFYVDGGDCRIDTDSTTVLFFTDASAERVGVGTDEPQKRFHIKDGDSGGTISNTTSCIIESDGNANLTLLTVNTATSYIHFADPDDSTIGRIQYDHNIDTMDLHVNGSDRLRIHSTGQVEVIATTDSSSSTTGAFICDGGVGIAKKLYVGDDLIVNTNLLHVDVSEDFIEMRSTSSTNADGGSTNAETLKVIGPDLGSDEDDRAYAAEFTTEVSNTHRLQILTNRHTAGSGWSTSEMVLRQVVDVTNFAFISFKGGATASDRGLYIGSGGLGNYDFGVDGTGITYVYNTTDSSSNSTGSLVVSGGVGIAKKLYVGDNAQFEAEVLIEEKLLVGSGVSFGNVNVAEINHSFTTTGSASVLAVGNGTITLGAGGHNAHELFVTGGVVELDGNTMSSGHVHQMRMNTLLIQDTPGTASGTITKSATLYIQSAPNNTSSATITNGPYAIFVDNGDSRFDGVVSITDSTSADGTNGALVVTGGISAAASYFGATVISGTNIEIGQTGSGNRNSYIDFHADDTYTDYALRIIRNDTGANASSIIRHRGTGDFMVEATDAAAIKFETDNTERMSIDSSGVVSITNSTTADGTNGALVVTGGIVAAQSTFGNTIVSDSYVEINRYGSGDRNAFVDFVSDDVNSASYSARLIRGSGENGGFTLSTKGTGALTIQTTNAARIVFDTSATERMAIDSAGDVTIEETLTINGPSDSNYSASQANSALLIGVDGGKNTTSTENSYGNIAIGNYQIYTDQDTTSSGDAPIQGLNIRTQDNPDADGSYIILSVQASGNSRRLSVIQGTSGYANGFTDSLCVGAQSYTDMSSIYPSTRVTFGTGANADLYVANDAEVDGVLYVGSTTDASSSTLAGVIFDGGLAVAKKIYTGTGLYLPTSGGDAQSELNYYEQYTQSITFSGIWASNQTVDVYFTRIGNLISMTFDDHVEDTMNSSNDINSTTNIPSRFRPNNLSETFAVRVDNDGIPDFPGSFSVSSTGGITVGADMGGGVFSGSGNGGFKMSTFHWIRYNS